MRFVTSLTMLALLFATSCNKAQVPTPSGNSAKCKEIALDQIAKGSQVVFQVAGGCGLGALSAAADKKVWGVGVDRGQSDLGATILPGAVNRVKSLPHYGLNLTDCGGPGAFRPGAPPAGGPPP